jgi:hypothetical protein
MLGWGNIRRRPRAYLGPVRPCSALFTVDVPTERLTGVPWGRRVRSGCFECQVSQIGRDRAVSELLGLAPAPGDERCRRGLKSGRQALWLSTTAPSAPRAEDECGVPLPLCNGKLRVRWSVPAPMGEWRFPMRHRVPHQAMQLLRSIIAHIQRNGRCLRGRGPWW